MDIQTIAWMLQTIAIGMPPSTDARVPADPQWHQFIKRATGSEPEPVGYDYVASARMMIDYLGEELLKESADRKSIV